MVKLRLNETKNCQKKGVRYVSDYLCFEKAFRSQMQDKKSNPVEDEAIVRPATSNRVSNQQRINRETPIP